MAAVESAATEVKTAAMADMVLDAASDADLIMSYLKKLQDQLFSTQKDAQRVASHSVLSSRLSMCRLQCWLMPLRR